MPEEYYKPWGDGVNMLHSSFTDEVQKFVVAFMRFEFVLGYRQQDKFLTKTKKGLSRNLDWGAVATAFTADFFEYVKQDDRTRYFIENPPSKPCVINGVLDFPPDAHPPLHDTAGLFTSFTRIRHNLFHGGKPYLNDRDLKLVQAGNVVFELIYAWTIKRDDLKLDGIAHNMFSG